MRGAWLAVLGFVLSPFALLATGGLPPVTWWRAVIWAVLLAVAVGACVRRRRFWPLALAPLSAVSLLVAMRVTYPCWRASNAAWCGHYCDDDPCSCSDGAYGAGPGCPR